MTTIEAVLGTIEEAKKRVARAGTIGEALHFLDVMKDEIVAQMRWAGDVKLEGGE